MDSRDQRQGAVSRLVDKLRKTTRLFQILPFAYLTLFVAYLVLDICAGEKTLCLIDAVAYGSPAVAACALFMSKLLGLCIWQKVACLLPMTAQIEGYIDSYIITLTQQEVVVVNLTICGFSILFLAETIRHFFHGK